MKHKWHMNKPEDTAPRGLGKLFGMLPTFIKGHREKTILGKGRKVETSKNACRVCGVLYVIALGEEGKITVCPTCKLSLDSGLTAILSKDLTGHPRYCFAKMGEKHADMAGRIVPVSPSVFDKIQAEFNQQKRNQTPQS